MLAPTTPRRVFGWDIGGSNTKLALIVDGAVIAVRSQAFELRHAPGDLASVLGRMLEQIALPVIEDAGDSGRGSSALHAVTMTAELSRAFLTKREGVSLVLAAVEAAFPLADVCVFAVDGRFLTPVQARLQPLAVAASNWAATAHVVAERRPDAILIDIGTTSTDIIPIVGGRVVARGRTDPERLACGELVYTGALRTPAEAMARTVPFAGMATGVAAEAFALSGDVYLWRGDLTPHDYTCATPDGRSATREAAGHRLARVVCADREMLDDDAVSAIADALAAAQEASVRDAVARVWSRHPGVRTAVVAGLGAFIGARAARAAGLDVQRLAEDVGESVARSAPAACVALLLARALVRDAAAGDTQPGSASASSPKGERPVGCVLESADRPEISACAIDLIVKLGGSLLAHPDHFATVLEAVGQAAQTQRLLVVPGGGPFADAVRHVGARLGLADDAAHWMAVLAMDQYAHLIASRLTSGVVVHEPGEVTAAFAGGRIPVLAPFQWLRRADPLPHSWDVTSDSIAAWVAGAMGAPRLVLVKSPGAAGPNLVDAHFAAALPPNVTAESVPADAAERLRAALIRRN